MIAIKRKICSFASSLAFLCVVFLFGIAFAGEGAIEDKSTLDLQNISKTQGLPLQVDGRDAEEIFINTAQGRFKFTAEIADTPEKSQKGLMFREQMAHNHGMLFNFGTNKMIYMWMKNTPLSLDMVFLSPKGRVVSIAHATTPFSEDVIDSGEPAFAVLEINAGVSKLLGLKAGDMLEHRYFMAK